LTDAVHLRGSDLDDQHLGEELDAGAEQMTGVTSGTVFLETDGHMDVRYDPIVDLVISERAAAESLDVSQVDLGLYRCVGIIEPVAGADDLDLAETGDEALAHIVVAAELVQGGEEVVAVVEGDGEAAAEDQFVATHGSLPPRCCR
jgi:hypothetical protein